MFLIDFMRSLNNSERRGNTEYYNSLEILTCFSKDHITKLEIDDSVLLTPFYLDDGTYEIYWLGFNIFLLDDNQYYRELESRCRNTYKEENAFENKLRQFVAKSNPYINTEHLENYIRLISNNKDLQKEICQVFNKNFDSSKLYFEIC